MQPAGLQAVVNEVREAFSAGDIALSADDARATTMTTIMTAILGSKSSGGGRTRPTHPLPQPQ